MGGIHYAEVGASPPSLDSIRSFSQLTKLPPVSLHSKSGCHGFSICLHKRFGKGRNPKLQVSSISGQVNFQVILNLQMKLPIAFMRFAQVSSIAVLGTLIITSSSCMVQLASCKGLELKRSAGRWLESMIRESGIIIEGER